LQTAESKELTKDAATVETNDTESEQAAAFASRLGGRLGRSSVGGRQGRQCHGVLGAGATGVAIGDADGSVNVGATAGVAADGIDAGAIGKVAGTMGGVAGLVATGVLGEITGMIMSKKLIFRQLKSVLLASMTIYLINEWCIDGASSIICPVAIDL
jgi:hypothetical protein